MQAAPPRAPQLTPGVQGDISADGRFVAFTGALSRADGAIFVLDRSFNRVELVSKAIGGGATDRPLLEREHLGRWAARGVPERRLQPRPRRPE